MNDAERDALAEQYADGENLEARIALHENHEVADRDWWPWVFDHYDLPADADVLEVGCGTVKLWQHNAERVPTGWDLLLTDFSPEMAADARATLAEAGVEADVGVAAAESIPLPDDSVDAVIANHMLYHVDREVALPGIRRVLRPGGRLYATTNGESNLRQLRDVLDAVSGYEPVSATEFSLENGPAQFEAHFEAVHRYERECALRVPDLEPLVAYAASLSGVDKQQVAEFADLVEERLADGPMEIEKSMGLIVGETAPAERENR